MNHSEPIFVTKSFTPPESEFQSYVHRIFETSYFTNNGPLLKELERQICAFLNLDSCCFVTNGTLAIQLALRALGITEGEIITTPFSYVATTSAILWERCTPVFVDMDPRTLCIDPNRIEAAVTPKTRAILPVHVFGGACDVAALADISKRYGIPVVYDAAHAFGSELDGKSLLSYGEMATCSFHATKLFHTIEGGCVVSHDPEIQRKLDLLRRFGHNNDEYIQLGINAKASEFQAAMGLANLPHVPEIIADRRRSSLLYDELLAGVVERPTLPKGLTYNYAYYPVLFRTESELLRVQAVLEAKNIHIRRYFYPSLNTLPYLPPPQFSCPQSETISSRIACLPLFYRMEERIVKKIGHEILKTLKGFTL